MSTVGTETSSRAGRVGIGGGREVEAGSGRCSEGEESSQKLKEQMLVMRLWEALGGTASASQGISSISLINLLEPGTGEGDKGVDGWRARGQGDGTGSSDASMTEDETLDDYMLLPLRRQIDTKWSRFEHLS
jgi:hypothetical protein